MSGKSLRGRFKVVLMGMLALGAMFFAMTLRTPTRAAAPGAATGRGGNATVAATGSATTKAATTAPEEDNTKHEVHVGVYVNQFKSIDIKTNTFVVDFWVWFRWKGDGINPLETFEVVGGTIDNKASEARDEVKGFHYAQARVTATVTKFFDIARFPLDSHTISLDIEDSEREEDRLVYIEDKENSNLPEDLQVPGWQIVDKRAITHTHEYSTNYGNISLETGNKSSYSRFSFQVDLVRPGLGYFFKLFWSLFLATVIALLAMLIDPIDLDPRFGLGVGAIFAAIASAYVISSALPETNQFTLADKMNMLAIGIIFLSILQSVFSLRMWKSGNEAGSKVLDRYSFWGFLALYGVATVVLVTM